MNKTLTKLFGKEAEQANISSKIEDLISLFNYSPDDLLLQWETYKTNVVKNTNEKISEMLLDALQSYIQEKLTRQNEKSTPRFSKLGNRSLNMSSNGKPSASASSSALLPNIKRRKLTFNNSSANTSMELGSEADANNTSLLLASTGQLLESLSPNNVPNKETTNESKTIRIEASFEPSKYNYNTQYMKTLEAADYLDEQIEKFYEIIQQQYNCEDQIGDPNRMSQAEIVAIGRIVPDSPLADSKTELNFESIFLETARSGVYGGYGKRVKLNFNSMDVSELGEFSFFPGQLIALKGINNEGEEFKVQSIMKIPYLGSTAYSRDEIRDYESSFGDSDDNLKVAIAQGPFHTKSTLDFTFLQTFVEHLNTNVKPDVVIMIGPFLDIEILSKMKLSIEETESLQTPSDIFQRLITPILSSLHCSNVIMVPHNNDTTMTHNVYPQPGFNRKELGLPKQFKCFPNPSIFHLNEVGLGVSNIDIFRGLKDIPINSANSNLTRIDRIVSHILQQRHFHPHEPAMSNDSKTNVDVSYLGLAELAVELPDILILPSVIKRFAKVIKNVIAINPGQLVKGDKNGSFAVLEVTKPKIFDEGNKCFAKVESKDEEEVSDEYLANLWNRARVDIYSV